MGFADFPARLSQLQDVDTTSIPPEAGDLLYFDGLKWVPGHFPGIVVQPANLRQNAFAVTAAGGLSISCAWEKPTLNHSLLLAVYHGGFLEAPTISEPGWVLAQAQNRDRVYYLPNAAPEAGIVTFTGVNNTVDRQLHLLEILGIKTTGIPLDKTAFTSQNLNSAISTWSSGRTAALAQNREYEFAVMSAEGQQRSTLQQIQTAGWVKIVEVQCPTSPGLDAQWTVGLYNRLTTAVEEAELIVSAVISFTTINGLGLIQTFRGDT